MSKHDAGLPELTQTSAVRARLRVAIYADDLLVAESIGNNVLWNRVLRSLLQEPPDSADETPELSP